jgi:hypothetical protein
MNRKELLAYHDEFCGKMRKIVGKKNADYTGHDFAFTNFCQIEVDGLTSTEVGIWTRFRDKTSRLLTFLKGNVLQVADEKVEDTILDACNYLIILAAYLKYKRELNTPKIEFVAPEAPKTEVSPKDDPWHCKPQSEVWNTELGPITVNYGATR